MEFRKIKRVKSFTTDEDKLDTWLTVV